MEKKELTLDFFVEKEDGQEMFKMIFNMDMKEYLDQCCRLIMKEPKILIAYDCPYDADVLKTIAQAIIKITEYCFKYKNNFQKIYESTFMAIDFLEIMQKTHNCICFYDFDTSDKFICSHIESSGIYLRPERLVSSVILLNTYNDPTDPLFSRTNKSDEKISRDLKSIERRIYDVGDSVPSRLNFVSMWKAKFS
jgi:hypothetical protein